MQGQDQERATQSLDQTGVSTSTQVTLNIKTDLGGVESSGLHAQCLLDTDNGLTSLQKVSAQPDPNPNPPTPSSFICKLVLLECYPVDLQFGFGLGTDASQDLYLSEEM